MAVTELELMPRRMCSLVTRDGGEDPTGSVTAFNQLLVLELPLPWPRDVRAALPAGVGAALDRADTAGASYRLQAVVPDQRYTPDGLTRLIHVVRPAGSAGMSVYDKTDFLIPRERLGDLVTALIGQPEALAGFNDCREPSTHIRDVLVCTHGTRDRCCGTFGYPVYNRLRRAFESDPTALSRIWRTSHLGGHRFAPTLVDLPDGRAWAHLDEAAVSRLERRDGLLPDLRRHYRGWAALGSEPEMIAERAVLAREGWAWTTRASRGEITSPTDPVTGRTGVRLWFTGPGGVGPSYYDAVVEPTGVVTRGLSSCGDVQPREHRQLHVIELTRHELGRPRRHQEPATAAP
jgi:hypothetical protein